MFIEEHKEPIEFIKVWLLLGYPSNILGYPSKYRNYTSKKQFVRFLNSLSYPPPVDNFFLPLFSTFLHITFLPISQIFLLNIKDVEFNLRIVGDLIYVPIFFFSTNCTCRHLTTTITFLFKYHYALLCKVINVLF